MNVLDLLDIVAPAIFAGALIAVMLAPLGIEVLNRGIIFIDLAIAQIAGLGMIAVVLLLHDAPGWAAQGGALIAAAGAGLFFRFVEQKVPDLQEAIIGASFVTAASLALLMLANEAHGAEEFQHLLSGQILFVTWNDGLQLLPLVGFVLAVWFLRPAWRAGIGFYLLFALAITAAVQLVGVYVVFAALILPAIAAQRAERPTAHAWGVGLVSLVGGISLAALLDLPAGPLVVVVFAVISAVSLVARRA